MVLVIFTAGLWAIVQWILDKRATERARAMCHPHCTCVGMAASYRGWDGSIHTFDFHSRSFAVAFALENLKRLVSEDRELRRAIDDAIAADDEREAAERARTEYEAEDALVYSILEAMEKARGPASRRSALERGLSRLTRPELREHVVLEAAKIEVRAVLDKVDSLKSTAAKRRHLEDGLAALRDDPVPDAMQAKEIALLEEALRELEG